MILGPSDAWSIRRSTQQPSVLYWRLSDFWSLASWSGLGINWVYSSYCSSRISRKPGRTSKVKRLLSWYVYCTRYAKTWCWTLWQCDVRHGAVISRVSSQPRTYIWHRSVALLYFHILRLDSKSQVMLKYWRRCAV